MTSGVSQPTNPGSPSRGLAWKQVIVQSVDGNSAVVTDQLTKTFTIAIDKMPAKGIAPAPGDVWLVHRQYGPWTFALCLNAPTNIKIGNTAQEAAIYGDLISSCSRFVARDIITSAANRTYVSLLGQANEGMIVNGIRIAITTGAAGTITAGVYSGPDPSQLSLAGSHSFSSASTGLISTSFSTPIPITVNQWMAIMVNFSVSGVGTAGVTFGGIPGVFTTDSGLIPQSSFTGSLPATANLFSSSPFIINNGRIWVSLH